MNNSSNYMLNNNGEDAKKASSSIMRKCCACGKIADREEFIRILREHMSGEYIINPNNFQFGRSTYVCKNSTCLKTAIKKKRIKLTSDNQLKILNSQISE